MRLTVLGGGGGYPTPTRPCGGYLIEHAGCRLLIDPGHATMSRLVEHAEPESIDSVVVTHGHADHCADLNALLRARHLATDPPGDLSVYAPAGALDALLAVDSPMLDDDWTLTELSSAREEVIGPFTVTAFDLPHFVPNLGVRISAAGRLLAYTGDAGTSAKTMALAHGADLLLAEASFTDEVPEESADGLSSASHRGMVATEARIGHLVLCHVWPGQSTDTLEQAARRHFSGPISVATPGLMVDV